VTEEEISRSIRYCVSRDAHDDCHRSQVQIIAALRQENERITGTIEAMREAHRENCEALQKELAALREKYDDESADNSINARERKKAESELAAAKEALSAKEKERPDWIALSRHLEIIKEWEFIGDYWQGLAKRLARAVKQLISCCDHDGSNHLANFEALRDSPSVAALLAEGKAEGGAL
jgi:hypothetical protein